MEFKRRKDKRGRILQNNEYQLSDGRYRYRYKDDVTGKYVSLYSWRLDHNDPYPKGKKKDKSLREKKKEIEQYRFHKIAAFGSNFTVNDLCEKYTSLKVNVKESTTTGYRTSRKIIAKYSFGNLRIDLVKTITAKEFLIKLHEDGYSYSSIHCVRGVLRPAFQMAVDDDLLLKNPFSFELASVLVNDSVTREAISRKDEKRFMDFIQNDKHYSSYYDAFYILFNTGLRISEFCGLTINDINLKEKYIDVNKQLVRYSDMSLHCISPKTETGNRKVPMFKGVEECFRRILTKRDHSGIEKIIDGYSGFLCFDNNYEPCVAQHWQNRMKWAVAKYNRIYKVQLPPITPHVCRHTFCSNMAKSGMSPKVLQYIMGHSDISVTLNVYTHADIEMALNECSRIDKEMTKSM